MDKFPKIETIEATLFGLLIDEDTPKVVGRLSKELRENCPSYQRILHAAVETIEEAARNLHSEIGVSVVLALAFQAGVIAERARAECEQLTSAMRPETGDGSHNYG